jgi:ABC-2 type transport system permease protein
MSDFRQVWLIARRELRERTRSSAFRASLVVMVLAVVAVIVLPSVLTGPQLRDIGLTGRTPAQLPGAIQNQLQADGMSGRIHRYSDISAGEQGIRDGDIDVLVVGVHRAEWPKRVDEQLKAVLTGAIQLSAVQQRAAAGGISPGQLRALVAPVRVTHIELSKVAGRNAGDETATIVMIGLMLMSISVYGALVLSGVVEEKSNRVVEVLLTRVQARTLLAGKVLGIGLLGLAQVAVTAVAAAVAVRAIDAFDVPAVRGAVLAWAVVWFVLGYALYATLYGALGSLASRQEDAQSVAGPAMMVLIASYFAVFFLVAHADSAAARALSYFPLTAPMAMPSRIAMGAAEWWEPFVAAVITVAATAWVVRLGGRLYSSAILHGGPTISLRDAWQASASTPRGREAAAGRHWSARTTWNKLIERTTTMADTEESPPRRTVSAVTVAGVLLGIVVAVLSRDVIIGVIAGSLFIALTLSTLKLWIGGGTRRIGHP